MTTSTTPRKSESLQTAFHPIAMNGYSMDMWRIRENLINWDALFALGFTSYKAYLNHVEKHNDISLDVLREILIRLYMIEPTFPTPFVSPTIEQFIDFLFNIKEGKNDKMRKSCAPLLAQILGRNRGSGYRWLRSMRHAENAGSLPIRRIFCKVFSMDQKTARENFWRAALATAHARNVRTDILEERLKLNGVEL